MSGLVHAGARELARRVRTREVSAREVVDAFLARIAARDGGLGAYLRVAPEAARAAAVRLDDALARGEPVGPLAGVPVAVKDVIVTEGLETTAGSKILAGWVPPYQATAVARLVAAGAIVVGKTSCDEFAMGSSNEHTPFGPCRNPWDPTRVPGGSSGGSAAAVAADLAALALGTDTGGSIRQPAAFCGVVGWKPTYGRISRWGAIAFASSLDQIGPLAGTVGDAALALDVMCGVDPRDATSVDAPPPGCVAALDGGVRGLTIGLPREYLDPSLDGEIAAAVHAAAAMLTAAGARVLEVSLPHTHLAGPAYYVIAPAEAASNLARYDGVRYGHRAPARDLDALYAQTRAEGFGAEVKRRVMIGNHVLRAGSYDAYYRKAQQVRALIRRDFDDAFATCDALLAPIAPTAAFPIGSRATPVEMYLGDVFTLACNLAGLPGLAVPCGMTASGLPLGVQLLGRPLDEATLARCGAVIEAAQGPRRRPPEVAS